MINEIVSLIAGICIGAILMWWIWFATSNGDFN